MATVEELARQVQALAEQQEAMQKILLEALRDNGNTGEVNVNLIGSASSRVTGGGTPVRSIVDMEGEPPIVTESTPDFEALDKPSVEKLIVMALKLKADLSNYYHWNNQLRNVLETINVDVTVWNKMLVGELRPSSILNKKIEDFNHKHHWSRGYRSAKHIGGLCLGSKIQTEFRCSLVLCN